MTKAFKFLLLPALAAMALFFSCNKSDELTVDEAVDQALYGAQERGGLGRYGCYELVFPVTIALPNGRTVEVDSYDEIAAQLRAYFEANSGKRRARLHFDFVYPFAVVTQDGELLSVESEEQLRRLRAACAGTFGTHGPSGHGQHGLSCFEVVFPVTIAFPDGTTAEAADRQAANQLLRTWAHNNPGSEERPVITFPMTVKMTRSGDLVTVNSPDELRSLKAGCR